MDTTTCMQIILAAAHDASFNLILYFLLNFSFRFINLFLSLSLLPSDLNVYRAK